MRRVERTVFIENLPGPWQLCDEYRAKHRLGNSGSSLFRFDAGEEVRSALHRSFESNRYKIVIPNKRK